MLAALNGVDIPYKQVMGVSKTKRDRPTRGMMEIRLLINQEERELAKGERRKRTKKSEFEKKDIEKY